MNSVEKTNGVSFSGTPKITSRGFTKAVSIMPASFREEMAELDKFIREKLPERTTVTLGLHNHRVDSRTKNFTKTAKGAKTPEDLNLHINIAGDNVDINARGSFLPYWVGKVKKACAKLGLVKEAVLTRAEKEATISVLKDDINSYISQEERLLAPNRIKSKLEYLKEERSLLTAEMESYIRDLN